MPYVSLYVHLCVHRDHYIVKMGTQCSLSNLKLGMGMNNLLSIKIKCFMYKQCIWKIFLYMQGYFLHMLPPTPHILNT